MSDINTIKRLLADRAQSVAEMLLPGGLKEGTEWKAGSVRGEKGQSLGVALSGAKAGVWQDFATGEGGDLLDLYVACKGGSLAEALDWARSYLGLERPQAFREPRKEYVRPAKPKCTKPIGPVFKYLTDERKIPQSTIDAFKVGEDGRWMVFPYVRDGELVMWKRECIDLNQKDKKQISSSTDTEDCLFGWQIVPNNERTIIICEGEKDAMSWFTYGYPALSLPRGGGKGAKQKWIENEFDRLERFEKIYISTDMDKPGDEAAEEIISRLGRHRCYRVSLPLKDANACLMDDLPVKAMQYALDTAKTSDPEGLLRASEYTDKVIHLFWPAEGEEPGYTVPYSKLRGKLLFRAGELSLWSGASGSGKSQILSDCIPFWINQGSRICLASLEMKGEQSLRRMCKQTGGVDRPTAQFISQLIGYLDDGLLLYERVGKAGVDALLEVFDYARAKYGCDQFIIDSLMRLGIASDDYTGQEKAVFRIVDWTIKNNVHVHLVAHSRKSERGQGAPETEDVKGASEIGSNAFNIVTVWRNRQHEDAIKVAESDEIRAELENKPGVVLNVAKQRNGDFEGKVGLWFNQENYQYHSSGDRREWRRNYLLSERGQEAVRPSLPDD
ncbi:hypothetical protein GCM10007908_33800 [Rhizobium albus]|nr:hypothetical protein GCM10007908_33800 [Rhizobium albus]